MFPYVWHVSVRQCVPGPRSGKAPLSSIERTKLIEACRALSIVAIFVAFVRALVREARTIEERSPMIEITTRSSIRVKPFCVLIDCKINVVKD